MVYIIASKSSNKRTQVQLSPKGYTSPHLIASGFSLLLKKSMSYLFYPPPTLLATLEFLGHMYVCIWAKLWRWSPPLSSHFFLPLLNQHQRVQAWFSLLNCNNHHQKRGEIWNSKHILFFGKLSALKIFCRNKRKLHLSSLWEWVDIVFARRKKEKWTYLLRWAFIPNPDFYLFELSTHITGLYSPPSL